MLILSRKNSLDTFLTKRQKLKTKRKQGDEILLAAPFASLLEFTSI